MIGPQRALVAVLTPMWWFFRQLAVRGNFVYFLLVSREFVEKFMRETRLSGGQQ